MPKSSRSTGTRNRSKDAPKARFCLVCESVIVSTDREFTTSGHVNTFEHAAKKYAMTKTMADKVVAKLRSGVFGPNNRTLEIK